MFRESLPYILIAVAAAALIAVTVVVARLAWRNQVRRYIVGLMRSREAIGAALKTVESAVLALSRGTVQDIVDFAGPTSEGRHTFEEIGARMRIEKQELAELPLPKQLWPLAEALGEAASVLAAQTTGVGQATGEDAMDALMAVDVARARISLDSADGVIATLSTEYDLTDPAVYGGGLYI